MNIAAITMTTPSKVSFQAKKEEIKPLVNIEGKKDNEVVAYSNWGGNYAFPITAGQIREQQAEALKAEAIKTAYQPENKESEEEYTKRKLFSAEWFM